MCIYVMYATDKDAGLVRGIPVEAVELPELPAEHLYG
jgi:hypothetical protein